MLAVFVVAVVYASFTGLTVFMGDTFLLANRAKHLAAEFNLRISQSPAPLIYPPLYSVVLSIAYLFSEPSTIFNVTLGLHIVLTVSQVLPLFLLLRHYGELPARPAAGLAAALALAPASFPYTVMGMTEVLFCPVILWLSYALCRVWTLRDEARYATAGLLLAVALLTRSAATSFLLAFFLTALFLPKDKANRAGIGMATACFAALYGAWYLFELFFIPYTNPKPIFSFAELPGIFTNVSRLALHAAWFANCLLYYLYAPLSLCGIFALILICRKPALLRTDPLALFFLLAMIAAAVVPALVMRDALGGRDLTWNRYIMPCVVFPSLVAIRYRSHFNRATLLASSLLLAAGFVASAPSRLMCHFTDALALAGVYTRPPINDVMINLLFVAVPLACGWLWLRQGLHRAALGITAVFWAATHLAAALAYRNSGDLNATHYRGVAAKAYQIAQAKKIPVFYDPTIDLKDALPAAMVLYYWPNLRIGALPPQSLGTVKMPPGGSLLYFTTHPVPGLEPLGVDRGVLLLYEIGAQTAANGKPLAVVPGPHMPGVEMGTKDNRNVPVRWLPKTAEFYVDAPDGVEEADVRLTLATIGTARTASLTVNGTSTAKTYRVDGDFWNSPPAVATFRVRLKPGRNECKVTTAEPPSKLPDGREVIFLLVGDIAVEPVAKQSK